MVKGSALRSSRLCLGLCQLFLLLTVLNAAGAEAKRVLVVHSFGSTAPPFTTHSMAFETELTDLMGAFVDLDEVSLDVARYSTLEMEEALVEFMQKRQTRWQPDLVVPIGSPAGVFVATHRERLFSMETPVIYLGMDQRRLPPAALEQNATFVGESFDLPGLVDDMLQLAPATTNIAVVIGASPLELFWTKVLRTEYQRYANQVHFTWFNTLSFGQMLKRVAAMPPNSFILVVLLLRDATGVTHDADEALRRMHKVANAPINGIFQHQLGLGIVGGRLYQAEQEGVEGARIAARVLNGEPISNFPPMIVKPLSPRYDWRELEKWGISERRLPEGSEILFRQESVWKRYRWQVATVALVCIVQTSLILGLLRNRAKRRNAESAARGLSRRLIRAHEDERSRLARELHDDMTQRIARMAIELGCSARGKDSGMPDETFTVVRDGLLELSADIHALSYRLHPSILEDLGLAEALKAEFTRFSERESLSTRLSVQDLPAISKSAALCLFRVAQESLRNVARHARASTVSVSVTASAGGVELVVSDDGVGMDLTNQNTPPSLGLASMRERVLSVSGRLQVKSMPGKGTTIIAWVPVGNEGS